MKFKNRLQIIQEDEYSFPYHYVAKYKRTFSQCFNDTWGINYVATIEFLIDRLKVESFQSIADIGCGDGRFTKELYESFFYKDIVGIDYSERAIKIAKAMNPAMEDNFECLDITNDAAKKKVDIAVVMEVLEHIPLDHVEQFIASLAKLLKKDGLLFVTVPHTNKKLEYKHYQHFNIKTVKKYLKSFFEIIEIIPFEKNDIRKKLIDKMLTNKLFILNHSGLKNKLYSYYKRHMFFVNSEKECQRIFVKAQIKQLLS